MLQQEFPPSDVRVREKAKKWITRFGTGYFNGVTSSRTAKRTVWLAVLGLATATPPALAAEGGASPLPDPAALAAGIVEQAGIGDPLPTLPIEQPLAPAVELPAAPAQQAAAEPGQTGADAAPPPPPVAEPPPGPAAQPVPVPAAPAPDAPPAAVQQEPANVNVSIRVDSPGDDGPVTQVNVAVGAESGRYQPGEPQYQPVVPAPDAPVAAPDPAEAPATEAGTGWDWTWNWSCDGATLAPVTLPAGAAIENWNWIWNWNCGGESAPTANNGTETSSGYHSAPVQYRPVNINVSIRINSPGANGPVTQANVAVGVAIPLPAPEPPAPGPAPVIPAPAEPPVATGESAAPAESPPEAAPAEAAAAEEQGSCCLLPERRVPAPAPERPASFLAGGGTATATGIASLPGDAVAVAARLELQVRSAATAARPQTPQLRPAQPRRGRPAPQRRETDEEPSAVTQSGLGIVPVGGPERSLPFAALVLLAFAFASANSSLASVRSRPTRGTDADDPPDRPG
jgi:hypothetical protein